MKALVVDDEKLIVKGLKFSLEQEGMEVDCAYDGEEAVRMVTENEYDIVLLDVMLPKLDGLDVCRSIRGFSDVPVIMLTAKGDDMEKILGFENGADDYVTKPFNILELKARVKAILRRSQQREQKKPDETAEPDTERVIIAKEMRMNRDSRRAFLGEREINLTAREFDLLELLMSNPGKVYSRDDLLNSVWGKRGVESGDIRTVDVHIRRLREKIEPVPSDPRYIHTRWGIGYFFEVKS